MLLASWLLFSALAVLWTAGAWLVAELMQWAIAALTSGAVAQAGRDVAALPLPDWARVWLDPAWIEAVQSFLQWAAAAGGSALPWAGAAAGWLVPLVWVGWGLGLALLLLAAVGAHLLVRRIRRRPPAFA